jgi:hypothetical protein
MSSRSGANAADDLCSWCGTAVEPGDGYRAAEPAGERVAAFCRLEHVVPWAMQGARWSAGVLDERPGLDASLGSCAHCGESLGDAYVLLVRRRGEARVPDAFCCVGHLEAWAKAGGRWR